MQKIWAGKVEAPINDPHTYASSSFRYRWRPARVSRRNKLWEILWWRDGIKLKIWRQPETRSFQAGHSFFCPDPLSVAALQADRSDVAELRDDSNTLGDNSGLAEARNRSNLVFAIALLYELP